MSRHFLTFLLVVLLSTMCLGVVKITNITVPANYTIQVPANANNTLVLDCEYEIGPDKSGFELKWLLDNDIIYHWIGELRVPYVIGSFKGKIDLDFNISQDERYKYRAIHISKPSRNMTGTYSCLVETTESSDVKSAYLQVIDPDNTTV